MPAKTHGHASRKNGTHSKGEYNIWTIMKQRCNNKNNHKYSRYGGRGITVCDRWLNSFERFLKDMGCRPSVNHSIDRIDNNGNYEPSNCHWATRKEQANNKSNNYLLTLKDKTHTIHEWADITGIDQGTIKGRIKYGWSIHDALTKPVHKGRLLTYNGETKTLKQWGYEINVNPRTIKSRLNSYSWSVEKALTTPVRRKVNYEL